MDYDIWTEKYRPLKIEDVCGQDEITKRLKSYVKHKNMPHLLFTGKNGTGKTTAALSLANEILGNGFYGNFKEINSSDSRGIDTVRGQIKDFVSTQPIGNVPFKILSLEEVDSTTNEFQAALRRIMEQYSGNCKFILTCNYVNKIIEPVVSRTAVFKFKSVSRDAMKQRLFYVAEKEHLTIDDKALDAVVYIAEGDLRKAISCLEVASLMGKEITIESVYKTSGIARCEDVRDLIMISLKGNFMEAIEKLDVLMMLEGLSSEDLLSKMMKEVMIINITDKSKADCVNVMGETSFRISEGSDSVIQMKWLIANFVIIGRLNKS